MSDWDECSEQDYWYGLGLCSSIEQVAKEFRKASGEYYADGRDERAAWCREMAAMYERRAGDMRKRHDERSKRRNAAMRGAVDAEDRTETEIP